MRDTLLVQDAKENNLKHKIALKNKKAEGTSLCHGITGVLPDLGGTKSQDNPIFGNS